MKKIFTIIIIILVSYVVYAEKKTQRFIDSVYTPMAEKPITKKQKEKVFRETLNGRIEIWKTCYEEINAETHEIKETRVLSSVASILGSTRYKTCYDWVFTPEQAKEALDSLETIREEIKTRSENFRKDWQQKREKEITLFKKLEKLRRNFWNSPEIEKERYDTTEKASDEIDDCLKKADDITKKYKEDLKLLDEKYSIGNYKSVRYGTEREKLDYEYEINMRVQTILIEATTAMLEEFIETLKDRFNETIKTYGYKYIGEMTDWNEWFVEKKYVKI